MRVLTLNCWNVTEPFAARMTVLRAALEALAPDVLGLQEIVVREDGFDQARLILEGLGYEHVFGPAFRWTKDSPLLPLDHRGGDGFGNGGGFRNGGFRNW